MTASGVRLATAMLASASFLAFAPGVAQATFLPAGSVGSPGSADGQFGSFAPLGAAVDPSSGDVYLSDTSQARVEKLDSAGNFVAAWGWGVAQDGASKSEVCTSACQAGISGSGSGQFGFVSGMAVDPSSGDVYVADLSDNRVEKFDSQGNFILMFGGGVDQTTSANVCTAASGDVCGAGTSGPGSGQFAGGFSWLGNVLAVDSLGNVYVADTGNARVEKFDPNGNYLAQITTNLSSPVSVALDPLGNVYVADTGAGAVEEYDSSGAFLTAIGSGTSPSAVATDPAGDLFAFANSPSPQITEYDPTGTQIDAFGSGTLQSNFINPGIAFSQPLDGVYVSQPGTSDALIYRAPKAPAVDAGYASGVTGDGATLGAQIRPMGDASTYHFEYGTTTAYGQSSSESASVGSDFADHGASAHVQSLSPSTTYHYRVVATNSLGTSNGPDHTFTTQSPGTGFALPDNRSYELVSPVDKNGSDAVVSAVGSWATLASTSGDAVTYTSVGNGFAGASSSCFESAYLSRRTPSGWTTQGISPAIRSELSVPTGTCPASQYPGNYFNADLSAGLLLHPDAPLTGEAPEGEFNLYVANLADPANPTYQSVTTAVPPGSPPYTFTNLPLATLPSADLSHVVFAQPDVLTPGAAPNVLNAYEWAGGQLRLVDEVPPAGSTRCGGAGPACVPAPGGGTPGADMPEPGTGGSLQTHAVSADGSRIFFSSPSTTSGVDPRIVGGAEKVYVRENGTTTVDVSASQRSTPDPAGPAYKLFSGASTDGSLVLFTSCEKLTDDATAVRADPSGACGFPNGVGNGNPTGQDLYQYNVDTGHLSDLTVDHNAGDPLGADVQGVPGESADGSYVYFVADGDLASGATSGQPNLYLYHGGTVSFIATVVPGHGGSGDSNVWSRTPFTLSSRVTPDGLHLAFQSVGRPTGYDNTDAETGQPDSEVYLYDATTDRLTCASCNPTGARPSGPSTLGDQGQQNELPRNLSDDGSRLFFDSADPIVPGAGNGASNVYEWEGGHVYLLDPARGSDFFPGTIGTTEASFLDASPSGNDVFVATRDQLWPNDTDNLMDVYDVRVCTSGSPCLTPPASPPSSTCVGDSCRGPLNGPPAPPVAASVNFTGPGNTGPSGAKGTVRVLSRTVRGTSFLVRVSVPGAGRITVSGAQVEAVTRAVARAGTYGLKVALTPAAKRALERKRKLKLKLNVGYAPADGASSATATLTVQTVARRRPPRRARRSSHKAGGAR